MTLNKFERAILLICGQDGAGNVFIQKRNVKDNLSLSILSIVLPSLITQSTLLATILIIYQCEMTFKMKFIKTWLGQPLQYTPKTSCNISPKIFHILWSVLSIQTRYDWSLDLSHIALTKIPFKPCRQHYLQWILS